MNLEDVAFFYSDENEPVLMYGLQLSSKGF